jgi:hypothetical protein
MKYVGRNLDILIFIYSPLGICEKTHNFRIEIIRLWSYLTDIK